MCSLKTILVCTVCIMNDTVFICCRCYLGKTSCYSRTKSTFQVSHKNLCSDNGLHKALGG